MGDIAQRGNRLTFAKGGRAGHALGHTAGRRLTKTLERLGGGEEGKPHSTRSGRIAAGVRKIKRKKDITNKRISKDLVQDVFNVVARKHSLGQQGKPHSSKEGRTASFGRTVRDVKKIFSPERDVRAEGGRTGLKKGGPKPGTHDYFLLHKREKKAGGGTLLKQTVKKVAKKIKAKKDTESVKGVR